MTKIKICGLFRPCDIAYVNETKPDYCGFILHFPKSHRNITPEQAQALTARLSPEITPVGVFVNQPAAMVADLLRNGTIAVAQLHGQESDDYIAALRALAPGRPIWKAFQIRSAADVEAANRSTADTVLLDNGYGTGKQFDWTLTDGICRPYFLAGGLTPENLSQAIRQAHPAGVDLSSGVETDRVKDREKIAAAVAAVRQADKERRK